MNDESGHICFGGRQASLQMAVQTTSCPVSSPHTQAAENRVTGLRRVESGLNNSLRLVRAASSGSQRIHCVKGSESWTLGRPVVTPIEVETLKFSCLRILHPQALTHKGRRAQPHPPSRSEEARGLTVFSQQDVGVTTTRRPPPHRPARRFHHAHMRCLK